VTGCATAGPAGVATAPTVLDAPGVPEVPDTDVADAERVAKRAITFNKDDKDANITYGQVLANEQKYDEARTQFEVAAKLDPKDARPIVLEAGTYVRQNAMALAGQVYDRALSVDPNNQEALAGKATLLANEHNVKDAFATYEKLLALQNSDLDKASVVDQEAHMYAVEKMSGEADAAYKRAINDYPKVPNAHLQYGDYLAFSKDMAGAEREWTTAAGPNRDYPEALARLGEYYASKNQLPKAVDYYKRLTEVANQDPKAFLLLGQAYGVNKQYDKARDAFKQSYSLSHTPESLFGLAQADYQSRNYRECADIYSTVDRNAPQLTKQNPQLLFLLGQCYQKGGDSRRARDAYARFLPYLKPGSQAQKQVQQIIADIDRSGKPKPAAKPSPKSTQTSQKK
ncbi:MAG: tetratricopeptide repeat protein, partial [Candidatus Velthaea sp.]